MEPVSATKLGEKLKRGMPGVDSVTDSQESGDEIWVVDRSDFKNFPLDFDRKPPRVHGTVQRQKMSDWLVDVGDNDVTNAVQH